MAVDDEDDADDADDASQMSDVVRSTFRGALAAGPSRIADVWKLASGVERAMTRTPKAFLLHGFIGAGKTTLAKWLEHALRQ